MNGYDNGNGSRRVRSSGYLSKVVVGAGTLLLAILLGFADAVVLSGLSSASGSGEMVVPVRIAALLTIAVVLLTVGAAGSFQGALRQYAIEQVETEGRDPANETLVVEETDVFNVRSNAA